MGMLAGVSDLCISLPGSGMAFMEIKARAGRLSAEQEWFLSAMERNGHRVAVVRSLDDALGHLADWGAIRATRIAA